MRERTRRVVASAIAFGFATGGFVIGISLSVLSGLWFRGGWGLIVRFSQQTTDGYFWLIVVSGILGGSLGAVLGAILGVLLLRRVQLVTKDDVRKFFATGRI